MATEKLYTVAGITTYGAGHRMSGETKVRFGNDLVSRIKIFSDAERVNLIELPQPSTKLEALQYLATHADFQDATASFAIQSKLVEKTKVAKKGEIKIAAGSIKSKAKAKSKAPVEA